LKGLRILATGYNTIKNDDKNIDREYFEKDLIFTGFLVFENKLK